MSAILQQNEMKALQYGLERLPDSFWGMRIEIAMNGDNRTLDLLAEIEQLALLSQERGFLPYGLIDVRIKLRN